MSGAESNKKSSKGFAVINEEADSKKKTDPKGSSTYLDSETKFPFIDNSDESDTDDTGEFEINSNKSLANKLTLDDKNVSWFGAAKKEITSDSRASLSSANMKKDSQKPRGSVFYRHFKDLFLFLLFYLLLFVLRDKAE